MGRRDVAIVTFQFTREQRHEGGGEGPFGEQAAEQIGQAEGDDESVGDHARAQEVGDQHVADEAEHTAEQRVSADGGDRFQQIHGTLVRPDWGQDKAL